MSAWLSVISRKTGKLFLAALLVTVIHSSLFAKPCFAAEQETTIVAQTLEYFSKLRKYVAKGSVRIEREGANMAADEITFHDETGEAVASGNVQYTDPKASIRASKAEINMEAKTGRLHDADIFLWENNYRLKGAEIEKKGEYTYASEAELTFTTCDDLPAAWCFRGKQVEASIGDRLQARDATFRVRDLPVLYTPYLTVPLLTERKTGFLMPVLSNSSERGFGLQVPFYWAIAENRDATFVLDVYTKRGIGTGIEYRFLAPGGISSAWWLYHIRDTELETDFTEFRGLHENRKGEGAGWFLNVNYVNEKDFYREFNPYKEKQIQRFLESTGELNIPFEHSRLYLLSQYWIDLKNETGDIPQRLPEVGYIMRYTRFGSFLISADATASYFWRKNGVSADRIDLYPRVLHTAGSDVVFSQVLAARGTAYALSGERQRDDGILRKAFEYDASVHTRLFRQYAAFLHVIEPTVRYHHISSSENDLPLFDSTELFRKKSRIELSLLNRFMVKGAEVVAVSVTQPIDVDQGDRPFGPLEVQIGMTMPLPVKLEASYDVHTGKVQTVSSEISLPFKNGMMIAGQRFNRDEHIMVYKAGIDIRPMKPVLAGFRIWYDAKGEGLTNVSASMGYESQCWGVRVEVSRKTDDTSVQVIFDLFGVTAKPSRV